MKIKISLLATLCLLFAVACTNKPNEMEQAAKGYLQAMGNYKMDEAAPYATRQTRENAIPTMKKIMSMADTVYIKQNTPATITIKGSRLLTDTSARVYYHKHTPIKDVDDSVTLLLEEGQWLVDIRLKPIPYLNMPDTIEPHIPTF